MLYNFRDDITNIVFWELYDEAKEECVNIVTSSKKWAIEFRSYNIPERSLSELLLYAAIGWASYEEIKEAFERVYLEEEVNLIGGESEEYFEEDEGADYEEYYEEYYEEPEED